MLIKTVLLQHAAAQLSHASVRPSSETGGTLTHFAIATDHPSHVFHNQPRGIHITGLPAYSDILLRVTVFRSKF